MFKLEIEIGNEAMQTPDDVAGALFRLAEHLQGSAGSDGLIRDENGNTVGRWSLADA